MVAGPIFLLASERSGTNLLRRRFSEHQHEVIGPSPLHLLKHLHFAEPYYGDLWEEENFFNFVEDALGLAYYHFSPWDVKITCSQVLESYPTIFGSEPSSVGIMHTLYTLYAQSRGCITYFCKDNNLFDFVADIQMALPEARFIYLYRDPRDVILSQLQRPFQNKSIIYLSKLWQEEQIKCIRYANSLERRGLLVNLSYEYLISNEEDAIENLFSQLGLENNSRRVAVYSQEKSDIQEWENLGRPTIQNNSGKFREKFSRAAISKIEGVCWHQMRWLGYKTLNEDRPQLSTVGSVVESMGGKLARSLRVRFRKNEMTEGQKKRIYYAQWLRAKWR